MPNGPSSHTEEHQTDYVVRRSWRQPHGAYHGFFTLWKDAGPDIPILKEAQSGVRKAAVKSVGDSLPTRSAEIPNWLREAGLLTRN